MAIQRRLAAREDENYFDICRSRYKTRDDAVTLLMSTQKREWWLMVVDERHPQTQARYIDLDRPRQSISDDEVIETSTESKMKKKILG